MIVLWIGLILLVEGFYSGSELALLSSDPLFLKKKQKEGHAWAKQALILMRNPDRVLATTLIMTSFSVMTITTLLTLEMNRIYGDAGEIRAVAIGSTLVILFGELLPKFYYRRHAQFLLPWITGPIFWTQKIMSPLVAFTSLYSSQISKLIRPLEHFWMGRSKGGKNTDLDAFLTADQQEVTLKKTEKSLISRILRFREKVAKDAYVPLTQVDAIEKSESLSEAFKLIEKKRHSRIPVYEERLDNIVGHLELSQVINTREESLPVSRFLKAPFYVTEYHPLESVFREMMERKTQLAIVVDEYGGAVGILTREDILEQIVGNLEDEDDPALTLSSLSGPLQKITLKGRTTIAEVNEAHGLEIPEGEYDTIAGFLIRQMSKIPERGEEIQIQTASGNYRFVIREASPRRIESILVERLSDQT